ncbi:MAG: ABC transporter substrate-binding protein, partial [Dehalococcoidia bacterium]
ARRRLLGTVLAGGAGAAFLAACGDDGDSDGRDGGTGQGLAVATSTRAAETAPPKPGGVVNLRQSANAPLDPHANATFAAQTFASYVLARLLKIKTGPDPSFANNFELEPDLAQAVETPGDGRTVTCTMRAATFHNVAPVNGRAVDSEDVKFSLERFRNEPKNNNRTVFGTAESPLVEAVETPDARTVVFKLAKPYGPFLSLLANANYLWIMPKELSAGAWDPAKQVIGAGPFMLESTQPDIAYKVRKNPAYFLPGQPYVDSVNLTIIAEEAQEVAQFQAGRLELAGLPAERMEEVRRSVPKATILEFIPQTLRYLAMQQRGESPLRDERVRRAAQMAIDRDALISLIYLDRGDWTTAIPANFGAWRVDPKSAEMGAAGQWFKHNPAESKKLLAAAGYGGGFPVRFNYSNNIYGERFNQEAEAVAGMLKEAGFTVQMNPQDYLSQYITPGTGTIFGNYEGMVFGTAATYSDPHEYFITQYYSKSSRNTAGVNDPQLDALILKEEAVADINERQKLVKEIQVHLADKVYYGQTVVGPAFVGVQEWLKNYQRTNGFGVGGEAYNKVWIDRGS